MIELTEHPKTILTLPIGYHVLVNGVEMVLEGTGDASTGDVYLSSVLTADEQKEADIGGYPWKHVRGLPGDFAAVRSRTAMHALLASEQFRIE